MTYLHRNIEKTLLTAIKQFSSIAITGPRQSGKSTLLQNIFKEYKYITFDDPFIREQALSDPNLFIENIGKFVILDEIQYVPEILSYIKIQIDKNRNEKGLYVFTGSQQFNLIKNLADSLAGRIALFNLLPFSFTEIQQNNNTNNNIQFFVDAAIVGSYPELVVSGVISSNIWYSSYVQTYLERDIKTIYNIGNLRDFQKLLQLMASRCGQICNLSDIANELGVSVPTVKSWVSVLESSKIVYLLPPYWSNFGKRITKSPKIYFYDIGLASFLAGIKTKEHLLNGPMAGALFENYIIQELIKFFFNKGEKANMYYLRTNNKLEIDIIIETSFNTIIPIEVKLNTTPKKEFLNNIHRFENLFGENLKIFEKYVISPTEEEYVLDKNSYFTNIQKFLEER